jgi:hypothetical protein
MVTLHWSRTNKTIAAVAAFAIYFVLAGWTKLTWVDPVPRGRVVFRLERPFELYGAYGVACYQLRAQDVFESVADTDGDPTRSSLILYEDNRPLGPAHSSIEDVGRLGRGRYSHSKRGLVFSASDNSDINENKHIYWAVLPN